MTLFALVLVLFSAVMAVGASQLEVISASNTTQLRDIFFSGKPWVVLCESPETTQAVMESRLSDAIEFVRRSGEEKIISAGVVDCKQPLPSKNVYVTNAGKKITKNIIQKYRLDDLVYPLAMTVANGGFPQQIEAKTFKTSLRLASHVAQKVKLSVTALTGSSGNSDKLKTSCLNRISCALVLSNATLTKSQKRQLNTLKNEFRATTFVYVNASSHVLSLESKLPALKDSTSASQPRLVYFSRPPANRTAAAAKQGKGAKVNKVKAKAYKGLFEVDGIRDFLTTVKDDKLKLINPPTLTRRVTKSKSKPSKKNNQTQSKSSGSKKTSTAKKNKSSPSKAAKGKAPKAGKTKGKAKKTTKQLEKEQAERERQRRLEMEEEQKLNPLVDTVDTLFEEDVDMSSQPDMRAYSHEEDEDDELVDLDDDEGGANDEEDDDEDNDDDDDDDIMDLDLKEE